MPPAPPPPGAPQQQPGYYQQPQQQGPPPGYYQQTTAAPPPPPPPQQQPVYYQQPQQTYPQTQPQNYQQAPQQNYQQPQPQPQNYQQPQQTYYSPAGTHPAEPAHGRGMNLPVWLMTVVFALAIGGVVLGIVWLASSNKGSAGTGPAPAAVVESPAAKPGAKVNPMQKYIEVTGVRFVQDAKKNTQVKFVVINHSEADISGLAGNVTIWGRTKRSEEDAQGTFSFSTNLAPYESKELTVPLNTKLKIYELGDWQNITTDVQITAPA
jgi:hypothetical protein